MTKTFSYFKYIALRTSECSANVKFQQISLDSKSVFFNVKFYFFSLEFLF